MADEAEAAAAEAARKAAKLARKQARAQARLEAEAKLLRSLLDGGFCHMMTPSSTAIRCRDHTDDLVAAAHKGAETGLREIRGSEEDDTESGRGCFLHSPRI